MSYQPVLHGAASRCPSIAARREVARRILERRDTHEPADQAAWVDDHKGETAMTSNVPEDHGPYPASEATQPTPPAPTAPPAAQAPTAPTAPPAAQAPTAYSPTPAYSPPPAPVGSQGQPNVPVYTGQVAGQVAPMSQSDERMWGMFAHLAPFVGALVGLPFLGALVVYLVYKDRSAFVRGHALESLNFQLTLLIGYLISVVLFIVVIGFFTAAVIGIASIVFQILGAVAANRGEEYRYPVSIRFVH
jgi:uncharacterized Tic20 family protein